VQSFFKLNLVLGTIASMATRKGFPSASLRVTAATRKDHYARNAVFIGNLSMVTGTVGAMLTIYLFQTHLIKSRINANSKFSTLKKNFHIYLKKKLIWRYLELNPVCSDNKSFPFFF